MNHLSKVTLRWLPTLAIVAVSLATSPATGRDPARLKLVTDGNSAATLVLAKDSSPAANRGAAILNDHFLQISGARLPVARVDDSGIFTRDGKQIEFPFKPAKETPSETFIALGESFLTRKLEVKTKGLGPGGILIKTFPGGLVLLGADQAEPADPYGSTYAVTTFLERELGVRFLWPGELGKVVPKQKTIEVGPLHYHFSPMILQRKIRMSAAYTRRMEAAGVKMDVTAEDYEKASLAARKTKAESDTWGNWHRLGGSLELESGHAFGHFWEKYGKDHPEWFAMASNGSRDQSASMHRSRLCVSNPELIDAIVKEAMEKIEAGATSIAVGPNDGGKTSFCTCENCTALDEETDVKIQLVDFSDPANRTTSEHVPLTDRFVHFWNAIAGKVCEKHPDVLLVADAYSVYREPPVKAKLHPHIVIRYVGVQYDRESTRQQHLQQWQGWAKAANRVYYRSNLLLASRRMGTPAIYPHKLARDFRQIANNGMLGTDFDSCMHHWSNQGLNYYVLAKLLWDPNRDVDEILDDYYESGFGKAAPAVKRYFVRLEELTDERAEKELHETVLFTPEVTAELGKILDEAAGAVAEDSDERKRIAFLRTGLDWTEGMAEIYRVDAQWKEIGGRLPEEMKERVNIALDANWERAREIFHQNPLAVNTTYTAWGCWHYFRRFGWREPPAR